MRRVLLFVAVVLTFQFNLFADTLSYVDLANNDFGTMDLNTGAFTSIANIGADVGLAFSGGVFYSVDNSGNLIRINQSSGATTVIGNTGVTMTTIAAQGGEIYGVDVAGNLDEINPATGAATKVGSTGLGALSGQFQNSLAGNSALYYTQQTTAANAELYTLNTGSGVATAVGPTAADIGGMGFINNTLYGFVTPNFGPGPSQILVINPLSGAPTVITPTSSFVSGAAPIPAAVAAPEPGSLILLSTGLAGLVLRRRKRVAH